MVDAVGDATIIMHWWFPFSFILIIIVCCCYCCVVAMEIHTQERVSREYGEGLGGQAIT